MINYALSSSDIAKSIASSTWTDIPGRTILESHFSSTRTGGRAWETSMKFSDTIEEYVETGVAQHLGLLSSFTWTGDRAWGTPMEPSGDMGEHARTGPVQYIALIRSRYATQIITNQEELS